MDVSLQMGVWSSFSSLPADRRVPGHGFRERLNLNTAWLKYMKWLPLHPKIFNGKRALWL